MQDQLNAVGTLPTGEATVTTAGNMKAKFIIHVNGPKFHEPDTRGEAGAGRESALKRADEKGLATVAFPPIGTGLYQVPLDLCASVLVDTVSEHLEAADQPQGGAARRPRLARVQAARGRRRRGEVTCPRHEPSGLLHTVEIIHWIALGVMAVVYTLRDPLAALVPRHPRPPDAGRRGAHRRPARRLRTRWPTS